MSAIRFFTDEDVYAGVALAMHRAGFDTVTTPDMGRTGATDESQLSWAAQQDRAIVTFNVGHFAALHSDWTGRGQRHSGIVVSSQRPIGEVVRRLLALAKSLDGQAMQNRLEFLSDW